jgi:hypothetical protein
LAVTARIVVQRVVPRPVLQREPRPSSGTTWPERSGPATPDNVTDAPVAARTGETTSVTAVCAFTGVGVGVRVGVGWTTARAPGIDADDWTPRELRHSFVSRLSDSGVPIEEISRLVGHRSTVVTEIVYREQLRPVIQSGATAMDRLFAANKTERGGQFRGQEAPGTREPGSLAEGTGL